MITLFPMTTFAVETVVHLLPNKIGFLLSPHFNAEVEEKGSPHQLSDLTDKKIKAIVISPAKDFPTKEDLKKIKDLGIPIVSIGSLLPEIPYEMAIQTDWGEAGKLFRKQNRILLIWRNHQFPDEKTMEEVIQEMQKQSSSKIAVAEIGEDSKNLLKRGSEVAISLARGEKMLLTTKSVKNGSYQIPVLYVPPTVLLKEEK